MISQPILDQPYNYKSNRGKTPDENMMLLILKQAKVESRIVIRVRAAAIGWQVSARALFEFCVAA